MNDGWDGEQSSNQPGEHHHRGTSRFNHRQYRTQHLRQHQHHHPSTPHHRPEHEHDSGTDDNDQLSAEGNEFTSIHIGEASPGASLHHRHHHSDDHLSFGIEEEPGIEQQRSSSPPRSFPPGVSPPPPPSPPPTTPQQLLRADMHGRRPEDDDYPLHHRGTARNSSPVPPPPPPPPPPPAAAFGSPGRQPKFGSPYRRGHGPSGAMGGHASASGGHMYAHQQQHGHLRSRQRRYSVTFWLRLGAAACGLAYLGVVVRSYWFLGRWGEERADGDTSTAGGGTGAQPPGSSKSDPWLDGGGSGGGMLGQLELGKMAEPVTSAASERARKWNERERRNVAEKAERRRDERRRRTRPPSRRLVEMGAGAGGEARDHLARYEFSVMDERWGGVPGPAAPPSDAPPLADDGDEIEKDDLAKDDATSLLTPADVEQLCGEEARSAAQSNPSSYLARDALSSKSRVLITGILNPLGFHLALALAQKCGVKTIMGIDPMYPNSVLHRLELQRRIAVLTKAVPGLGQPVMLPYVGLDPRLSPKKAAEAAKEKGGTLLLPGTGELNLLTFKPTHIVHLASASGDLYRDEEGRREGRWNDNSPYCSAPKTTPKPAADADGDGNSDKGEGDGEETIGEVRTPPLYEIRQASAGMEHLLHSVGNAPADDEQGETSQRPHLTYASHRGIYDTVRKASTQGGARRDPERYGQGAHAGGAPAPIEDFHPPVKLIDEVLARTYGALRGVYTVGLRLPDVYGPWGARGSNILNVTEEAVRHWGALPQTSVDGDDGGGSGVGRLRDELGLSAEAGEAKKDLLFVDDAVGAVIAAMQYRNAGSSSAPAVFDMSSGDRASLFGLADAMESLMPGGGASKSRLSLASEEAKAEVSELARERLGWSPRTALEDGITQTLAWYLDRKLPYGPAPSTTSASADKERMAADETGDAFLLRRGLELCAADDGACLRGRRRFPCASECSSHASSSATSAATVATCTNTPFDSILSVSKDLTEGCDVVLYTSSLGYDVEDIKLQATYEEPVEGEMEVCNVAFVPRESTLVRKAIRKVPESSLKSVGIHEKDGKVDVEKRLENLNGRILHRGWVLVWLPDAVDELEPEVLWLPKLSPGRLFASSVGRVMFVEEKFTVCPNSEDVLFLASEMHRKALPDRTFVRKDEKGKKHKYKLPAEPERRAAILFNTMKQPKPKDAPPDADKGLISPKPKKLSVYDAAMYMVWENGGDPTQSAPKPLKQQREFYERVPTFVNRDDLRSVYEPVHRYEMRHWVRSRWVLHDLTLEEGRQLRCEWYDEHLLWGNDLDQLSAAHVLARREVERKFARREPDDHVRAAMPKHPELEGMSDAQEWHAVLRVGEGIDGEDGAAPFKVMEKVPEHMFDPEEEEEGEREAEKDDAEEEKEKEKKKKKAEVDLFARIMSDKVMLLSRKVWQKNK